MTILRQRIKPRPVSQHRRWTVQVSQILRYADSVYGREFVAETAECVVRGQQVHKARGDGARTGARFPSAVDACASLRALPRF